MKNFLGGLGITLLSNSWSFSFSFSFFFRVLDSIYCCRRQGKKKKKGGKGSFIGMEEERGGRDGKGAGSKVWDSTVLLKYRHITFGFPDNKVELRLFETFLSDIVDSPV